jgi:hypothetical protein
MPCRLAVARLANLNTSRPRAVTRVRPKRPGVMVPGDEHVELASRAQQLGRDRPASDQIAEAPALVDPGGRHGVEHSQEPVMPTVHIGADADPH